MDKQKRSIIKNWLIAILAAAVQEKKQFSHYTTPGTGPNYLKNGGDAAVQKGIKTYL